MTIGHEELAVQAKLMRDAADTIQSVVTRRTDQMTTATQYADLKAQCPGTVLQFKLGDFYEAYFEDAETIANVCKVPLLHRQFNGREIPMACVPEHAVEVRLRELLQAGHRAAICEQCHNAKG